jgi:type IV fimbrial biogenesis protein FimT
MYPHSLLSIYKNKGYTTIELMVGVVLAAMLTIMAGPPIASMWQDNNLSSTLNEFIGQLNFARIEATLRHQNVVLCVSSTGAGCSSSVQWEQGWMIFTDPDGDRSCADTDSDSRCDADQGLILHAHNGLKNPLTLRSNGSSPSRVRFDMYGASYGSNRSFMLCDSRGKNAVHSLSLSSTGRVRINQAATCGL